MSSNAHYSRRVHSLLSRLFTLVAVIRSRHRPFTDDRAPLMGAEITYSFVTTNLRPTLQKAEFKIVYTGKPYAAGTDVNRCIHAEMSAAEFMRVAYYVQATVTYIKESKNAVHYLWALGVCNKNSDERGGEEGGEDGGEGVEGGDEGGRGCDGSVKCFFLEYSTVYSSCKNKFNLITAATTDTVVIKTRIMMMLAGGKKEHTIDKFDQWQVVCCTTKKPYVTTEYLAKQFTQSSVGRKASISDRSIDLRLSDFITEKNLSKDPIEMSRAQYIEKKQCEEYMVMMGTENTLDDGVGGTASTDDLLTFQRVLKSLILNVVSQNSSKYRQIESETGAQLPVESVDSNRKTTRKRKKPATQTRKRRRTEAQPATTTPTTTPMTAPSSSGNAPSSQAPSSQAPSSPNDTHNPAVDAAKGSGNGAVERARKGSAPSSKRNKRGVACDDGASMDSGEEGGGCALNDGGAVGDTGKGATNGNKKSTKTPKKRSAKKATKEATKKATKKATGKMTKKATDQIIVDTPIKRADKPTGKKRVRKRGLIDPPTDTPIVVAEEARGPIAGENAVSEGNHYEGNIRFLGNSMWSVICVDGLVEGKVALTEKMRKSYGKILEYLRDDSRLSRLKINGIIDAVKSEAPEINLADLAAFGIPTVLAAVLRNPNLYPDLYELVCDIASIYPEQQFRNIIRKIRDNVKKNYSGDYSAFISAFSKGDFSHN